METQMQERKTNDITRLESLAQEARMYAASATLNMLQLGRVFLEAKAMLSHGEFAKWCDENAGCGIRTAENMMAAYSRFGDRQEFLEIGKSKLFRMLTLPEGAEDAFIAEHDVHSMSSREVEKAIREVRDEGKPKEHTRTEVSAPDEKLVSELNAMKAERDRLVSENREMIEIRKQLNDELREMRSGSRLDSDLIQTQQNTISELEDELNRYRVSEARGEIGRSDNAEMTAEKFRMAVNEFMGSVHQVPQMGKIFAAMCDDDVIVFDTMLRSVEAWARDARAAIDTIEGRIVL